MSGVSTLIGFRSALWLLGLAVRRRVAVVTPPNRLGSVPPETRIAAVAPEARTGRVPAEKRMGGA